MKQKLILTCSALLIAMSLFADPIDLEKAKLLAANFMPATNINYRSMLVKKAPRKSISGRKLDQKYMSSAPYYIFSRGEGQGFVIVSGDDALPEVLGYTESGDFDEDNLPPFLTWYLDYYGGMIEAAQAANAPRMTAALTNTSRVDITPLIQTHWHQTSPYNDKCPMLKAGGRSLTGCVATAASQVLYYWHKDLTYTTLASTPSYTYGDKAYATTAFPKGTQIKWDLMCTQYSSEPDEYRDAVATLVAVVGGGAGLTYGPSTSGYNDNCRNVFSTIFGMNGGTENNKDWGQDYNNYSDDAWVTLLYNELINSRPVLYSGCNSNGEGHSVVVDGYQASTGYVHFNIGWGNPSSYDGYFTVARGITANSWGFNSSWQECVTGVYPKKQNLTSKFITHPKVYINRTNEFSFEVANNGTLDYSGIYFFANTTGKNPGSLSEAKDKDTETVLSNTGEAVKFTMSAKPTTEGTWYFIVTDKNLNVLSKYEIKTEVPTSDLWLKNMRIDGSTESEVHNGQTYTTVYNSKATALIDFEEKSGIGYEGYPRMAIYESKDDGQTFSYIGYKSSKLTINSKETATLSIAITSTSSCPVQVGNLYYGLMEKQIPGSNVEDNINFSDVTDTIVRFIMKGSDMEVSSFEDGCLKLTGTWDVNAFTTFAKKTAYKTATVYDLTGVTKISSLPVLELNPNALFYVSEDASPTGVNFIKNGVCSSLSLTPGYNFAPQADFMAESVTFNINQAADKWGFITVPCDIEVPDGIIARQINSHFSSGISGKTTNLKTLAAGHTYEIMSSSSINQKLIGKNVNVSKTVIANVDTAVVGTYVNTKTPSGAMQINNAEAQYVDPVDEGTTVEAFRGYFYASNVKLPFRAYSSLASDPTYLILGQKIESAYQAINEYGAFADVDSTQALLNKIYPAEVVFSQRTISTLAVRLMYLQLDTITNDYIANAPNPDADLDCTSYITNPSFENGSSTGWTTAAKVYMTSNYTYMCVGSDGTYFLYDCNADSTGSGLFQKLTGLKMGYYRLTAKVGSTEGHQITMFAGDSTIIVNASPFGKHYLVDVEIDDVFVDGSGEMEIGIKPGFFYKADDFHLVMTASAVHSEDVNGDGTIDTQDVLKVYEFMQNSIGAGTFEDVNGDGIVDTQDVLKIYEYIQNN